MSYFIIYFLLFYFKFFFFFFFFFFFNDTATTEIYTLSLHDALPNCRRPSVTGMRLLTRYADVSAVLADLRFVVPAPPPGWRPATVGWLRATVSRFSTGETHERRRAMVTGMLAGLDPAAVRQTAFDRVVGAPDRVTGAVDPAVPVRILASMLGVPGAAVEG